MIEIFEPGSDSRQIIEALYPDRSLPSGAIVCRFAPSPTGFIHIGGIYTALISKLLADQSSGRFILRIEDTDKIREIEGATDLIYDALKKFELLPDEGFPGLPNRYGPYVQSDRKNIYQAFARDLFEKGWAYPCFMQPHEIDRVRQFQQQHGLQVGIYGKHAKWRNAPRDQVVDELQRETSFVIRFRASDGSEIKSLWSDLIKGSMQLPANSLDVPILKSDGMPTYHFAHVVDDYLMKTTHVLRGDEWLNSTPLHLELFNALGIEPPIYGHIAPISKLDQYQNKRKLSKRKDPEANVNYFYEQGYPIIAVKEYLLSLASSEFESWRAGNPDAALSRFTLSVDRLSKSSGPLFDQDKLDYFSAEYISRMSAEEVYNSVLNYASQHDPSLYNELESDKTKWTTIFGLEREIARPRKDLTKWSDCQKIFDFFRNDFKTPSIESIDTPLPEEIVIKILSHETYKIKKHEKSYFEQDEKWQKSIETSARKFDLALSSKEYKANKEQYLGNITHYLQLLRQILTGQMRGPNLIEIMRVLGWQETLNRLEAGFNHTH